MNQVQRLEQPPLGRWLGVLEVQVYLACISTSFFVAFCTGQLEAWYGLVFDETPPSEAMAEGRWEGCYPNGQTQTHHWLYRSCNRTGEAWDEADPRLAKVENHPETFRMAPNIDCWEGKKIDHTLPPCEQPESAASAGIMGWEQLIRRLVVWLLLNHALFFIAWLTYRLVSPMQKELKQSVSAFDRSQKEVIGEVLFEVRLDVLSNHEPAGAL